MTAKDRLRNKLVAARDRYNSMTADHVVHLPCNETIEFSSLNWSAQPDDITNRVNKTTHYIQCYVRSRDGEWLRVSALGSSYTAALAELQRLVEEQHGTAAAGYFYQRAQPQLPREGFVRDGAHVTLKTVEEPTIPCVTGSFLDRLPPRS